MPSDPLWCSSAARLRSTRPLSFAAFCRSASSRHPVADQEDGATAVRRRIAPYPHRAFGTPDGFAGVSAVGLPTVVGPANTGEAADGRVGAVGHLPGVQADGGVRDGADNCVARVQVSGDGVELVRPRRPVSTRRARAGGVRDDRLPDGVRADSRGTQLVPRKGLGTVELVT